MLRCAQHDRLARQVIRERARCTVRKVNIFSNGPLPEGLGSYKCFAFSASLREIGLVLNFKSARSTER